MSGFAKNIPFIADVVSGAEIGYQPSRDLSIQAVNLFTPIQNYLPPSESLTYLDVPPPPLPGFDTGVSVELPPSPPVAEAGASDSQQIADEVSEDTEDDGSSDGPFFDPSLSIEQLIANGTIQANFSLQSEAIYDNYESRIAALFSFFGAEEVLDTIESVLPNSGEWLTRDQLIDPSQLTISMTADAANANFIIRTDGTVICNRPPLANPTDSIDPNQTESTETNPPEITIALEGVLDISDAQRLALDEFTKYLLGSLSVENESGEMISPIIDQSVDAELTSDFVPEIPDEQIENDGGGNYGGGNSGGGGGNSSGGGGSGGGNSGGGGGGGYDAPPTDNTGGYTPTEDSSTSGLDVELPVDQYALPDDTDPLNQLKATDALINGNGIGADRYTAVSGPTDNGYGVGAYNATAEGIANWIYNLSDQDLEAIEAGQCTADCPAAGSSARDDKGDGKGRGSTAARRQHQHSYPPGTAERLRALRAELTSAHGSNTGPLTEDDLTRLFSQHQSGSSTDGFVTMLRHMTNDPPVDASSLQSELAANFDPSLQERMANDLLREYGQTYIEAHPDADLKDTNQLRDAAGILMLAMHLGHYPNETEIASDSADPEGIISRTVAEVTPPMPVQDLGNSSLDPNLPIDVLIAHISSHEGDSSSINWNDNGHGISIGYFQWNQGNLEDGPGGLTGLLLRAEQVHPGLVPADIITAIHTRTEDGLSLVEIDFANDQHFRDEITQLVDDPRFAEVQLTYARERAAGYAAVAERLGFRSLGGAMIVADFINQMGGGGSRQFIEAAQGVEGERNKLNAILNALASADRGYSQYLNFYTDLVERIESQGRFDQPFS